MNFYIGNSVNEININDYNVELDDGLMSIINDLTKKINIDLVYYMTLIHMMMS